MRTEGGTARALLALVALLAAVLASAAPAQAKRPNVIAIVTDDQAELTFRPEFMPSTFELLVDGGTRFTSFVAATPVCCPSRGTMLTGQYSHNHGAKANVPGYPDLRQKRNILPSWLRRAGYRTAHVGRYLNNFERSLDRWSRTPFGWSLWRTMVGPKAYYGYDVAVDGTRRHRGERRRDYLTGWINRQAARIIARHGSRPKPLYLQIDHWAPHAGGPNGNHGCNSRAPVPSAVDAGRFAAEPLPPVASFNEDEVSDKPSYIADYPTLEPAQIESIERAYQCAGEALLAVDRGVARIWSVLGRLGERRNTIIMLLSDNGLFYGEHRVPLTKYLPYEEAVRVPFVLRLPPAMRSETTPSVVETPTANVDLAPTIIDWAGTTPCIAGRCRTLDGRSLAPLLTGAGEWPADRGIPLEWESQRGRTNRSLSCEYHGVRTGEDVWVQHESVALAAAGFRCEPTLEAEHYEISAGADPFQLENLVPGPPPSPRGERQAALAARAASLRDCAGIEGRDARSGDRPFCE